MLAAFGPYFYFMYRVNRHIILIQYLKIVTVLFEHLAAYCAGLLHWSMMLT